MHSWGSSIFSSILNGKYKIKYSPLIILVSISFAILFSFYSILKAYTINAYGWDLGLYSQAFYSTLHGHLFYTNLIGKSYLAEHFSPFVFLILPLFYLYPSPYTLLVIQSVFLSIAAIPLYYISLHVFSGPGILEKLKNPEFYAFIIAIAFLLSPLTESPVYFDFHIMVFLPFFYFMAIYFYIKKKFILNIIFLALIASLHSSFIFIVIMTIVMELLISIRQDNPDRQESRKWKLFSITGIIILLAYYIFTGFIKADLSHSSSVSVFVTGESGSASRSIEGLFYTLIYNPLKFFSFIASNYEIKILFLVLAFMAVDFTIIEYPIALLPALPYLAYSMISSYIPYYFIGYQYSMMFIPFIFVAGVFSIGKLVGSKPGKKRKRFHKLNNSRNIFIAISAFAIASFIVVSPISPLSVEPTSIHNIYNDSHGAMEMQNKFVYSIVKDINMNSTLVTGNSLYPLFYKDINAAAFPYMNISMNSHYQYLIANFNDSQTYLVDGNNISLSDLAVHYMNSGNYGIFAEGYGIIVLEYKYTGNPVLTGPYSVNYKAEAFNITGNTLCGPIPDKGVPQFQELEFQGMDIYKGNSTFLLPGNYTNSITFNKTTAAAFTGSNITVYSNYGKNPIANITGQNETISGDTITFSLHISHIYSGVLYKIYNVQSGYSIYQMSVCR